MGQAVEKHMPKKGKRVLNYGNDYKSSLSDRASVNCCQIYRIPICLCLFICHALL